MIIIRGDLSAWGAIVWREVLIFFPFRITCLPQASRFVSLQFWFQNVSPASYKVIVVYFCIQVYTLVFWGLDNNNFHTVGG